MTRNPHASDNPLFHMPDTAKHTVAKYLEDSNKGVKKENLFKKVLFGGKKDTFSQKENCKKKAHIQKTNKMRMLKIS